MIRKKIRKTEKLIKINNLFLILKYMARTYIPKKKTYRRKKTYRKKRSSIPRPLSSGAVFRLKRSFEQNVVLDPAQLTTGWVASGVNIYKNWVFTLSDLIQYLPLTGLFKYYKITGVATQLYFSNTGSQTEDASRFANSQLLCYTDINQNGQAMTGSTTTFLNSQTSKRKLCLSTNGRPLTFFHKCKQAGLTYSPITSGGEDYHLQSPKWISTNEPATPHYGLKMLLTRIDNQAFTSGFENSQKMKVVNTYYISLKKVQ